MQARSGLPNGNRPHKKKKIVTLLVKLSLIKVVKKKKKENLINSKDRTLNGMQNE